MCTQEIKPLLAEILLISPVQLNLHVNRRFCFGWLNIAKMLWKTKIGAKSSKEKMWGKK
jgi:hypothetical protein